MGFPIQHRWRRFALALAALVAAGTAGAGGDLGDLGTVSKWSKIEIDLAGPTSDALSNDPNPFLIDVTVQFSGPSQSYLVPAFFDGDGDGGDIGNTWRVRFTPDETGPWTFTTVSDEPTLSGYQGRFDVSASAGCAEHEPGGLPDFGCHGRLLWNDSHYLKLVDGPFWLKGGMDDPEDFLAPGVNVGFPGKTEVIDYLSSHGLNSLYFLTHNIGGDHDNVSPWSIDSDHIDLARMAEWEETLSYMQHMGIVLHVILEDDSAWTGFNRALYYREIVARFGHHNGLIWNISEEYNETYSPMQVKAFAQTISDLDSYGHPITVHHQGGLNNWNTFLGHDSFDLTSFQSTAAPQNVAAVEWWDLVEQSGRTVPVSFDETGALGGTNRGTFWSIYMGGANFELHLRPLDDYRDYEFLLDELTYARSFIEGLPFWEMRPANELLVAGSGYVFAKPGEVYAVYLPDGGNLEIDLSAGTGDFDVAWFNPRDGSSVSDGIVGGGETVPLAAPDTADWALVLRTVDNVEPLALDQAVETPLGVSLQVTLSYEDPDGPGPPLFSVFSAPLGGSLAGNDGDEILIYTPDPGFTGADSFTWQVDDGLDLSNIATVTINVHDPANTPPIADSPTVSTDEDNGCPILLSATDSDGDPLFFALRSSPVHGTLSGTPPSLHYTPFGDYYGDDGFTFDVHDGRGGLDSGTVSITVLPVPDRPLAHGYGVSTYPDTPVDLTLQATDADGDSLTYKLLTAPTAGTLFGEIGSPQVTYVPDPGFHGIDSFVFRVLDGRFRSNRAAVLVTVTETTALLWDNFDRPDNSTLSNGWVELEASGTTANIQNDQLTFLATADAADRPLVRHAFPRVSTGMLQWEFTFDWLRSGSEGTYRLFMQLGDGSQMTPDDQDSGAGISLLWSPLDGSHETLAYRSGGSDHALATIQGRTALSVLANLDQGIYEVRVDGQVVGTSIPLDQVVALDTVRFFTDNVNHDNFTGRTFDDLRISTVGGTGELPLSVVIDRTQLYWPVLGNEVGYDVIRGDLGLLRGGAGEFSTSVEACLANDLPATRLSFPDSPPLGGAWWFLVRAVESTGAHSYDTLDYPSNSRSRPGTAESKRRRGPAPELSRYNDAPMKFDLEGATKIARNLVRDQAAIVLDRWSSIGRLTYKNSRDFLSEVDLEVERNLKRGLRERFPDHGLCGEETEPENEDAEYQWLIDPIDGTKYYAASSSLFSISVGLLRRGDPVAGVVHLAASGQCFHAHEGGGAFLDDRKLEGPRVKRISEAIVNVDTPNSSELSAAERAWFENRWVALQRSVYRVRALGVGSLAACWLASGAFDAYVDLTGYHIPQDLAAGRVLMKEAGARVEFLDSGSGPPKLLATPPGLWEQMHRILKDGI